MLERYGNAIILVPIVSTVVLAVAVGAVRWARAVARNARARAQASPAGSAGPTPMPLWPGLRQRATWCPQHPALRDWIWSGGRTQPPDVLSGGYALYDTVVVRELRGRFRGRQAYNQVRRPRKLPVLQRSAPHTHWPLVTGLRSKVELPPFFVLTGQPVLVADMMVLDAADGLHKTLSAMGPGTVLWAEPRWRALLIRALDRVVTEGAPEAHLLASDGSTLFVCASRGEDEESVLQRLRYGNEALGALESEIPAA